MAHVLVFVLFQYRVYLMNVEEEALNAWMEEEMPLRSISPLTPLTVFKPAVGAWRKSEVTLVTQKTLPRLA